MRNAGTIVGCAGIMLIAAGFPLAVCAQAADVKSEIMTAEQHAELAAQAQTTDMVHSHLHHTLNCLVGSKSADFDAQELNPCKNNGNGAIPDTADAATKQKLKAAVAKAKTGLAENDLATAQKIATATASILDTAK